MASSSEKRIVEADEFVLRDSQGRVGPLSVVFIEMKPKT